MDLPDTVVIVSIDDLRYDALGISALDEWYAEYDALKHRNTPTFDELAADGSFFRHATSTSSYTPPSHASMFTGLYPKSHGVKSFFHKYTGASPTLAELLGELGYETHAWIENQALEMLNVTRGFENIVCPFEDDDANLFDFIAEAESEGGQTFVFVHLFDVHKPYCYTTGGTERDEYNDGYLDRMDEILPDGCAATGLMHDAKEEAKETLDNYNELSESLREYAHNWSLDYLLRNHLEEQYGEDRFEYLVKLYLSGVEKFDQGRFVDLLAAIDETYSSERLLCVTADHGEARCQWGDHEDFMNSFNVSEQAVRVPLVVAGSPDLPDESTRPVSHIDLVPTIVDLLSEEIPEEYPGRSLFELDREADAARPLFYESWYYEGGVDFFGTVSETGSGGLSEVAVRQYPYKLRYARADSGEPERALYDLSSDPYERVDLSESREYDELETELDAYLGGVDETTTPDLGSADSEDLQERLRALGYLE